MKLRRMLLTALAVIAALLALTACGPDNYAALPMQTSRTTAI